MNFAIAVKLVENGVQQGAQRIRNALVSIQMQALAMMAALSGGVSGLSDLLGKMIEVARETSRVQTALKNVSDGAMGFGKNLRFVKDLAQQYGLEVNGTTSAFTKFTAAASAAGMAMSDQQKVFSAVSRSISAFGLSGDEATLTFYAISQMMAKGKISAEELRRQLGERMPIAMEAMSRAAKNMGFKENLDDLLKGGKLRSLDILPKFAEELDKLVVNVDTDNAETSVNRLKNSFSELVDSWDITGKFKAVVDAIRGMVDSLKQSVAGIAGLVGGVLGGKLFSSMASTFSGHAARIKAQALAERDKLEKELSVADATASATKTQLRDATTEHMLAVDKARNREAEVHAAAQSKVNQAILQEKALQADLIALDKARAKELATRQRTEQNLARKNRSAYNEYVASRAGDERVDSYNTWLSKRQRALENHQSTSIRLEQTYQNRRAQLEQQVADASDRVARARINAQNRVAQASQTANQRIARSSASLAAAQEAHTNALRAQQVATQNLANSSTANLGRMGVAWRTLGAVIRSAGVAMLGMLKAFAPMVIIGAITSIITKVGEMKEAWSASKRAMEEYQTGLAMSGNSEELLRLERAIKLLEDKHAKEQDIALAKKTINDYLGTEIADTNTLLEKAKERLGLERQIARAKYADQKAIEAESELRRLTEERNKQGHVEPSQQDIDYYNKHYANGSWGRAVGVTMSSLFTPDYNHNKRRAYGEKMYNGLERDAGEVFFSRRGQGESKADWLEVVREFAKLQGIRDSAEKYYQEQASEVKEELQKRANSKPQASPTSIEDDPKKKKKAKLSDVQKAEQEWQEQSKRLANQLAVGAITQDEFNEALNELKEEVSKTLAGLLGTKAEGNATYRATKDYIPKAKEHPSEKVLADYDAGRREEEAKLRQGLVSEEQYRDAMHDLTGKTIERLASLDSLNDAERQLIEELKGNISRGGEFAKPLPQLADRDRTMDYKLSDVEKQELDREQISKYVAELERGRTELNGWDEALKEAQRTASSLDLSISIGKVRGDVQKLQQEVGRGKWELFRGAVGQVQQLSHSLKGLQETLRDEDATGLEKTLALIESISSVAEGIMSITEQMSKLKTTTEQLSGAQEAYALIQRQSAQEGIQAQAQEMAMSGQKTTQVLADVATTQGALIADSTVKKTTAGANIGAAASEGAAQAAKGAAALPFPMNIVAMAGAVAAALAIFRGLPKFANGGIVPGNSRSGDRVLAGVNSGELILNEAQQHNIASKLLRGNESISVDVHLKERLRRSDLRRSVSRATRVSRR